MQLEGNLLKMRTELESPVKYFLRLGSEEIPLNDFIGKEISMIYEGQINCISCGKRTKTSFGQGFCYNCLQTAPEASESIVRPELSKAHLGIARDMEWAEKHDLIEHIVYLAVSSEVKVGVTRNHQIPTRWIDQGASFATILAKTPNRHIAGVVEVFLKKHFTDRTNWQSMLKNKIAENINLSKEKQKVFDLLPGELKKYFEPDNNITEIKYPVSSYPKTVKSTGFDKSPKIEGTLKGIKGQYLIFDNNLVLNIRKHNGYYIRFINQL